MESSTQDELNSLDENKIVSKMQILFDKLEHYYYNNKDNIQKNQIISQAIKKIKNKENNLSIRNDIEIIKDLHLLSESPGGFLYIKNRKIIYKYLIELLYSKEEKNHKINEINISDDSNCEFESIIDKDCKRSVLYNIVKSEKEIFTNKGLEKRDLDDQTLINNFIEILKKYTILISKAIPNFKYYQGYQEITFYLLLLFGFNKESVELSAKFTLVFFDYFSLKTNSDNKDEISLMFLLDLISNCGEQINKKSSSTLNKITRTKPYFGLSWAITWFTHDNNNLFNNFRVFDFLILNNLSTVYLLSSSVIIDQFNLLKKTFNQGDISFEEDNYDFFMEDIFHHFQNLNYTLIDWDKLINDITQMEEEKYYNFALSKTCNEHNFDKNLNIIKPFKKILYADNTYKSGRIKKNKLLYNLYVILLVGLIVLIIGISIRKDKKDNNNKNK